MRAIQVGMVMLITPAAPEHAQTRVDLPRAGAVSVIGVRLADVTAEDAKALKLPRVEGAIVESVNPNTPASAAGVRQKDVIVEFDGERVRGALHLSRLVSETPVGRDVTFAVMRDGRKSEMHLKTEAGSWFDPRLGGMIDSERMR